MKSYQMSCPCVQSWRRGRGVEEQQLLLLPHSENFSLIPHFLIQYCDRRGEVPSKFSIVAATLPQLATNHQ